MRTLNGPRVLRRFVCTFIVHRKSAGSFTLGRYTPAASETTITVDNASLQPLKARELQLLPEGYRTGQAVKIYSPVELRTADPAGRYEADRIEYKGEFFEVMSVEYWDDHGSYWKATAVKQEKQTWQ